jgi:hypothetical protein
MRFIKLKMGIILCFILSHFRTFHPRHYTHARVQEVERKLHKRQDLNLRRNSEQRFVMIFPQNSIKQVRNYGIHTIHARDNKMNK